jgi:integrase
VREKNGCWYVFINHHNRRRAKKIGPATADNRRLANQAADRIRARLSYGEDIDGPSSAPPFRHYAEDYIRQVHATMKRATGETYERHLRRVWIPAFGKYLLDKISRGMVKRQLIKLLGSGLSRDYVTTIAIPLQGVFREAVDEELIKANPAAGHSRGLGPKSGKAREIFTPPEIDRLLQAALDYNPAYYVMTLILARAGLRIGEMLALQPEDLDFERRQVWVRRTWGSRTTRLSNRCINVPKSNTWRWVDMSPQLIEVLQGYLAQRRPQGTWLFPGNGTTLPLHPNSFRFVWLKLLPEAGLAHCPPHSLRHTYVSLLVARGESMKYIQEQLGHTSIKVTMDIYAHLMPGSGIQGADKLDSEDPIASPFCNLSATTPLHLVADGR